MTLALEIARDLFVLRTYEPLLRILNRQPCYFVVGSCVLMYTTGIQDGVLSPNV